ncbi:hypothetical protein SHIRM173S_11155 [Streptomyces hirsutus]
MMPAMSSRKARISIRKAWRVLPSVHSPMPFRCSSAPAANRCCAYLSETPAAAVRTVVAAVATRMTRRMPLRAVVPASPRRSIAIRAEAKSSEPTAR